MPFLQRVCPALFGKPTHGAGSVWKRRWRMFRSCEVILHLPLKSQLQATRCYQIYDWGPIKSQMTLSISQILKPAEKKQRFVYVGSIPKDNKRGTMKWAAMLSNFPKSAFHKLGWTGIEVNYLLFLPAYTRGSMTPLVPIHDPLYLKFKFEPPKNHRYLCQHLIRATSIQSVY